MTVHKVPEVTIPVKVKKIYIIFLFVTFFCVNSAVSMPEKPNILEIRYIAVQYSKDVFIYLTRVLDLYLQSEMSST